jgi:hypothetical protein
MSVERSSARGARRAAVAVIALAAVIAPPGLAAAEPSAAVRAPPPSASDAPPRHDLYLEALGRGGVWGAGYTYHWRPRVAFGAVASFTIIDGQRLVSLSPYVELYPVRGRHHGWFVDVGPQLVHLSTPSPVPEWAGTSDTGVGVELATGYEYRAAIFARAFAMVAAGTEGIAPWLGADIGFSL